MNEKVAYETALANAMAGRRSAVAMKQVGLNVASDPFMRSAYLGVKGGLIVIVRRRPRAPLLPDGAGFPLLRHVRQGAGPGPRQPPGGQGDGAPGLRAFGGIRAAGDAAAHHPGLPRPAKYLPAPPRRSWRRPAHFEKNARRWCATPQFLRELHRELNGKIERIAAELEFFPALNPGDGSHPGTCIIASGVAFAHTWDLLEELGLLGQIDFYQVTMPYPLNRDFVKEVNRIYHKILVLEETYPVIELQLANGQVQGRRSRAVPNEGELTPDVIRPVLEKFLDLPATGRGRRPPGRRHPSHPVRRLRPPGRVLRHPRDLPGGHLPRRHRLLHPGDEPGGGGHLPLHGRRAEPGGGLLPRLRRLAAGKIPTIVATIGDSTFFHAGIPALINAVFHGARIILVILDNATTAMTGHQPTPQVGLTATGAPGHPVSIPELVRACGVGFLKECDPYEVLEFSAVLKDADQYCRSQAGGPAVVIAKHACMLDREARKSQAVYEMCVTDCVGCRHCLENFECPALTLDEATDQVSIDGVRCVGCGVCVHVCPAGAIEARLKE